MSNEPPIHSGAVRPVWTPTGRTIHLAAGPSAWTYCGRVATLTASPEDVAYWPMCRKCSGQ